MTPETRPPGAGFILAHIAGCSLAWGSSFLFIKLIGAALPPLALSTLRGGLAALAVGVALVAMRQLPWPTREEFIPWAIIGAFNGAIPNTLVAFALLRMDSGPAVLIQSVGPLITAVASHLMFAEERLNARSGLGVFIGFVGAALLIGPEALTGAATLSGVLAMLGVALSYSIGNVYTRNLRHHDPIRLAMGQQLFSALLAGAAALTTGGAAIFAGATNHLWPLLALSVVCTALPIALFMRLIVRAGPTRAALVGYTVPAVAVAVGASLLGERLTLWQIAGGLTVLAGVFVVATAKRRSA